MVEPSENVFFNQLIEIKERKINLEKNNFDIKQKRQQIKNEIKNMLDILDKMLEDYDSLFLIKKNMFIKSFTCDLLVDAIKSARCEDLIKQGLKLLQKIFDSEYDSQKCMFLEGSSVSYYGSVLIKIMPQISEFAIDESFFTESEDQSELQENLLTLVYFILKTIRLRTLFQIGFKPCHLQFIIVNFAKSLLLPKIILAIVENLRNSTSPVLYEHDSENLNQEIEYDLQQALKKTYSISVKTFDLFFKLYQDNWSFSNSRIISNIHYNLAEYAKCKPKIESNVFNKSTRRVLKFFKKRLYEESNKDKLKNYKNICFIIEIIEFHFSNLNAESQKEISYQLMFSCKTILTVLLKKESLKKELNKSEMNARSRCFSLVCLLIENLKDGFITYHMNGFEKLLIDGIKANNKQAVKAFESLLRLKEIDLSEFIQKVIVSINRMMSVNDDDDEDNKNCMSYSKVIIAILDHSAATQSFELSCMPLVEKIRNNYKNLINSNINCVCSYACFLFRTLRAGYKSKKPISAEWQKHIESIVDLFNDLIEYKYRFNVSSKTYLSCLDLIEFFVRNFYFSSIIKNEEIIYEMLVLIETKLREDWCTFELYESEINDIFETINEFK